MLNFKSILFKRRYYAISYKLNFILKSNINMIRIEKLKNKKLAENIYKINNSLILYSDRFIFDNTELRLVKKDNKINKIMERLFSHCIKVSISFDNLNYDDFNVVIRSNNDQDPYVVFSYNDTRVICNCEYDMSRYNTCCLNHSVLIESNNISEYIEYVDNGLDNKNQIFYFKDGKLVSIKQKIIDYHYGIINSESYPNKITFYDSGNVKSFKYKDNIIEFEDDISDQKYDVSINILDFTHLPLQKYNYRELLNFKVGHVKNKEVLIERLYNKIKEMDCIEIIQHLNKLSKLNEISEVDEISEMSN